MDAGVSGCRVFGFSRQFRGEALPRVGFSRNPQRGGKGRRTETEAKSRIRRRAAGRKPEMPREGARRAARSEVPGRSPVSERLSLRVPERGRPVRMVEKPRVSAEPGDS